MVTPWRLWLWEQLKIPRKGVESREGKGEGEEGSESAAVRAHSFE